MSTGSWQGHVFILVHGTFARKAPWTSEGSHLCRRLDDDFPGCKIIPFDWSGRNSHDARLSAARELTSFLRATIKEFAAARVFLIAHSHGGNVALHAVSDPSVKGNVDGIVTMATPFIACSQRDLSKLIGPLKYAVPFAAFFLYAFTIALISIGLESSNNKTVSIFGWLSFLLGLILVIPLSWKGIPRLYRWISLEWLAWAEQRQALLAKHLTVPPNPTPMLCANVSRDEAAFWLWSLHRISNVPHIFHRLLVTLCKITFIAWIVVMTISEFKPEARIVGEDIGTWFGVQLLCLAIYWLFSAPLQWLLRGHQMGFGGEGLLDNIIMNVGVTQVPTSASMVERCSVALPLYLAGLRHSAVYNNQRFLTEMTGWISLHSLATGRQSR